MYDALDDLVLSVGRMLLERRDQAPSSWMAWALAELPFSEDQLRAIVAVTVSREVSESVEDLPSPWQALCG